MTETGHNSNAQLKSIIERIENREAAKQEVADDIKLIYSEAEGNGFDAAALRVIIRERKQERKNKAKKEELEAIVETYKAALGALSDLPLGRSALERNVLAAG